MSSTQTPSSPFEPPTAATRTNALKRWSGVLVVGALVVLELLLLAAIYDQPIPPSACIAGAPSWVCEFLTSPTAHVLSAAGALAILALARPKRIAALLNNRREPPSIAWILCNLVGFGLLLAPFAFLTPSPSASEIGSAFALWGLGGAVAAIGAGLAVASPIGWRAVLGKGGWLAAPIVLAAAAFVPQAAAEVQRLWEWSPITDATFYATAWLLEAVGAPVVLDIETAMIGVGDFVVIVGRECSGVEGFGLVTIFLAAFFWLFRKELRFPHALALLPIGLAASWTLNIVRIAVLILIGAAGDPELALNGFHSHAGWLMFTIVALALAIAARQLDWFHPSETREKPTAAAMPPLFQDPTAAQIVPFIVLMGAALLVSTASASPALFTPLISLAVLGVIACFAPIISRLNWRLDPVSIGVGGVVGVLWLATAPTESVASPAWLETIVDQGPIVFAIWAVVRVVGATVATPLVEELFFRGYVQRRLSERLNGSAGLAIAILVSAALFGALHDRWAAALLAGVAFGLVALRRGGVADAIIAHGVANSVIALWAIPQGDWTAF